MSRKPQMSESQLEYAADALRRGSRTRAELAAEFGVTPPAITAALKRREAKVSAGTGNEKRAGAVPPKPSTAQNNPQGDPAEIDEESLTKDELKRLYSKQVRKLEQDIARLDAAGETEESRRASAEMSRVGARLERLISGEETDAIVISQQELLKRAAVQRERIAALQDACRPNLCAHCNRELSVAWGRGNK